MHCYLASIAAFATVAFFASVQSQTYPRLEHHTQDGATHVLNNNSFIDRTSIEENSDGVLRCVSNNPACCSGNWFDDMGHTVPPEESNANFSFYTTTAGLADGHSVYSLKYRSSGNIAVGVFRCDVPDLNGVMQSLYIYLGSTTIGEFVA